MRPVVFSSFAALLILIVAVSSFAQQPPPMPTPAPEMKSVDYFVGTWKMEGDAKPGPMGPGGKFTGTSRNEWMDGRFFLVLNSDFKMAGFPEGKGLAVMGYDSEKKAYTYNEFNSMGESVMSYGKLDGDTWTWDNESKMGGQVMKSRFTIKQVSPKSYTFKFDMAEPGKELANVMEGKATKQ